MARQTESISSMVLCISASAHPGLLGVIIVNSSVSSLGIFHNLMKGASFLTASHTYRLDHSQRSLIVSRLNVSAAGWNGATLPLCGQQSVFSLV